MIKGSKKEYRLCFIKNNICYIPLACGKIAMCDEDRFDEVSKISWSIRGEYPRTTIAKKNIQLHRFLYPEYKMIDHINRNKLDNRSCNLRETTTSKNLLNQNPIKKTKSGHIGVKATAYNKWQAYISFEKKFKCKNFDNISDAIKCRLKWQNEILNN